MIGDKINDLKNVRNVSVQAIADFLGTSRSSVSGWINEPTKRTPSPDQVKKLASFFSVTSDYLLGTTTEISLNYVPLLGKASCGKPNDNVLEGYDMVSIPSDIYCDGTYAVEAEGNSMSPKINDGDIVYCCPNTQIENGKIVHYGLNGESGIKRYKINEAGTIISLIPINTEYEIITIHCDENVDLQMSRIVGKIDKDF